MLTWYDVHYISAVVRFWGKLIDNKESVKQKYFVICTVESHLSLFVPSSGKTFFQVLKLTVVNKLQFPRSMANTDNSLYFWELISDESRIIAHKSENSDKCWCCLFLIPWPFPLNLCIRVQNCHSVLDVGRTLTFYARIMKTAEKLYFLGDLLDWLIQTWYKMSCRI